MVIIILTSAVLCSAVFCIQAKYKKSKSKLLIFKPLTLILILLIATTFPAIESNYKIFIVTGLIFSLIGDIFLIFPEKHFKNGLIVFLVGHICYITAFVISTGFHLTYWLFIPVVIVGSIYLQLILPYSGKMKLPIIIYITMVMIMVWMAVERFHSDPTLRTILPTIGAILFMISDAVLALNKFRKPFYYAELIILTTYFTAQWFLAVSVIVA